MQFSSGILLHGPSGAGEFLSKRVVLQIFRQPNNCCKHQQGKIGNDSLASEASNCSFFSISSPNILSDFHGVSELRVKLLFELVRESTGSCAIIFFDMVDWIARARTEVGLEMLRNVFSEFLIQMDRLSDDKNNHVFVLASTNSPWDLDYAIPRQFEERIYVPLPGEASRAAMVKAFLGNTSNNLSEDDFLMIARVTEGASGNDLKVLVQDANMNDLIQNHEECWKMTYSEPYKPSRAKMMK